MVTHPPTLTRRQRKDTLLCIRVFAFIKLCNFMEWLVISFRLLNMDVQFYCAFTNVEQQQCEQQQQRATQICRPHASPAAAATIMFEQNFVYGCYHHYTFIPCRIIITHCYSFPALELCVQFSHKFCGGWFQFKMCVCVCVRCRIRARTGWSIRWTVVLGQYHEYGRFLIQNV